LSIVWLFVSLLVVFGLVVASRARMYGRLFGDEHWLEIGRGIAGTKAAALGRVIETDGDAPVSRGDPRIIATSSGLVIVYTVQKREADFVHHCSVGTRGGATAHAVGSTFVVLVAKLLGLPTEKTTYQIADSTIHHAEAVVDEAEHLALAAAPVPEVSAGNVAELRRDVMEAREGVRWR
jgi:hypothetical protein